eukprot:NODE_7276_length_793_cov_70.686567_g6667_i0.p1 GENE.NODE_7276_length_793_cov_70.686567_g6667_i0~~NODE_7276_length_793_cov_70.686567_g6667_i0.p1  ORF type:complete len:182 (-),score=18.76 NODE_7276_length_793_cov_70.686567_g6667_i0:190-735(-)
MSIVKRLSKSFKKLQEHRGDLIELSLRDDNVDQWEITFKYQNGVDVVLLFEFSIHELLPPQVTVVRPSSVSYVCFQELGSKEWNEQTDLVSLVLSLHSAMYDMWSSQMQTGSNTDFTPDQQYKQWEIVRNSHTDWNLPDIITAKRGISSEELSAIRKEGLDALSEENIIEESGIQEVLEVV